MKKYKTYYIIYLEEGLEKVPYYIEEHGKLTSTKKWLDEIGYDILEVEKIKAIRDGKKYITNDGRIIEVCFYNYAFYVGNRMWQPEYIICSYKYVKK
jgi:uncharacterized radical SAM superfamily Fe-S cluster-containing enzyme